MGNQTFWQFNVQHHEEDWPVDGVEAKDVFSDHVEDSSVPELVKVAMLILTITKSSHIVEKSIHPDVDHVFRIGWDFNPPSEGCA